MRWRAKAAAGVAALAAAATLVGPLTPAPGPRSARPLTGSIDVFVGTTPTPAGTPDPCDGAGYSFCDEFVGSSVDTTKWVVLDAHADPSNSEPGCYKPAQTTVTGGNLVETVAKQSSSCPTGTTPVSYISGAVQWNSYKFTNGTLEVRAKVAGCTGCWPAVWMLGEDCQEPDWLHADISGACNWPNAGSQEVDVAEFLSSDFAKAWHNIFTTAGTQSNYGDVTSGGNAAAAFHTYTMVRSSGSMVFKVDGVTTRTYSSGLPSGPMFLILNTSIGASGGSITDGTLPATTQIDYVHVTEA